MNRVELKGGITKEPEFKFLPSGAAVLELTVAVNGARWDKSAGGQVVTTSFISCVAWMWLAEQVNDLGLGSGDEVYVLGELEQRTFDKRDGSKDSKTKVTILTLTPTRRRSQAPRPEAAPAYAPGEEPF